MITNFQGSKLLGSTLDLGKIDRRTYIEALNDAHEKGNLTKLSKVILDSVQVTNKTLSKSDLTTDLRKKEKQILSERKRLGFTGTEVDALYGLGGFPKQLTVEQAMSKARKFEGIQESEVEVVAQILIKDDLALLIKRKSCSKRASIC